LAVITISRELGSDGSFIARQLAQALGYHLVDKSLVEKVLNQYGFIQFGDEYEAAPSFWERLDTSRITMIDMLNRVFQAVASHGHTVILGRGSFAVLSGFSDVLNIRIQAPPAYRIQRVMEQRGLSNLAEAEEVVKESDRIRSAFTQAWYGVRWDAASAFDLVIDTSKVPNDLAVTWIIEGLNAMMVRQGNANPVGNAFKVDPILAETVSTALEHKAVIS
jgi:cytidylate kinase